MITKYEFLKHWFSNKGYSLAAAVQSVITIQFESPKSSGKFKEVNGAIWVEDGKFWYKLDDKVVSVEGDVKEPFVRMHDRFSFRGDFHPILKGKTLTSTFGLMLANVAIMYEAFGLRVDYINKTFTDDVIKPIISNLMVDNDDNVPPDKATVDECLKFNTYGDFFRGLSIHFVKPGGVETLAPSDKVMALKKELLEKHKDELTNPVVFTAILEQLVKLDMEEMMSSGSKDFFISKGFITNNRKRMFGMFGIEPDPDNSGKFKALTNSLDEGLDPEYLVEALNEGLVGIYSRSKLTAQGGAQVKDLTQLLGRITVSMDDCGSKVTERIILNKDNAKSWVGSWYLENGKLQLVTDDNFKSLIGKPINMRNAQYCKASDGNKCVKCVGESLGQLGHRLGSEVVNIAQRFQLISMKLAHTSSAELVKLDLSRAIKI